MNIFLDTSSLFKLYHKESGTDVIELIFKDNKITTVFLSEIAKIEFASTVWKKVRIQHIQELQAQTILNLFENDSNKFTFIQIDSIITEQARTMIAKYGKLGLRTLDSIQLATAVKLKDHSGLFITSDELLNSFFNLEALPNELNG